MTYEIEPALLDWLLDTDPALRWQVERDLVGRTRGGVGGDAGEGRHRGLRGRAAVAPGRRRPVGRRGVLPARLRVRRSGGGPGAGQPWTATTWSLNSLREWGLDASVLAGTAEKLAANSRWEYDDLPYWGGEVDAASTRSPWPTAPGWAPTCPARRLVPRAPAARRWLELRVGRGLDALVVPLHPELDQGSARLRAATGGDDRLRAARRAGRGVSAGAPADVPPDDRRAGGTVGDPLRVPVPVASTAC